MPPASRCKMDSSLGRRVSGILIAVACGVVYLLLYPPLYAYDGITYLFYGSAPRLDLNPHHLLWVPTEYVLEVLHRVLHLHSTVLFQVAGIAVFSLTLGIYFKLLIRLGAETWLAAAICLFIALSPPVWLLMSQNLPYPLFFLFIVLFFDSFSRDPMQ